MSNYDEDFDEEIIDESLEETKPNPKKTPVQKFQALNNNSQSIIKNSGNSRGSIKDVDTKSKNSVRKTVALSKIQPKKEDKSQDEFYNAPLKNIPDKNPKRFQSPSYDDDDEDVEGEISRIRKGPKKTESYGKLKTTKSSGVKEFNLEDLGISIDKRSRSSTPPRTNISQIIHVSYFNRFRGIIEADTYGMSMKEIEADNKKVRETLKEMNDQLTKLIDRARVSSLAPKKMEFKNRSYEDKLRTTLKEIENNHKILDFTVNEYTAMKARIDQIKDPNYELDLEEKTRQTRAKIEEVKRANKNLNLATGNIAKDLDVIDKADGVAPLITEANEKARELAIMKRKLKKAVDQNEALEQEKEAKNEKLAKVQEEYNKLLGQAERYKVTNEDNKLAEKYNELKGKVKTYENHVKHTTNTKEKYLKNELEKNIEDLYVVNMRDNETLERLETMIAEQRTVLQEMIDNEEHKIDKNTLEVINKIKISMTGNKMSLDPTYSDNAESSKPLARAANNKPPAGRKSNYDMYNDLPLYNTPNVKVDSLLNKKDLAKKEIMAIKEKTKRDEEDRRSLTPKHEMKPKIISKDNSKPNLRAKDNKTDIGNTSYQQAEQERAREKTPEVKKKEEDDSVGLKPVFSKPNLFKKSGAKTDNKDLEPKTEPIQLPSKDLSKPALNNEREGFSLYGKKEEPAKEPEFKIPAQDNQRGRKSDALTLDNQGPSFFITDPSAHSKKGELTLPGSLGDPKKPLEVKKNEELTLGGNFNSQKKPLGFEDDFKPTVKQEPINNTKPNAGNDMDEPIAIGGLSRLNRLKKGGNNAAPAYDLDKKDTQTLELPGQKPSGLSHGGPEQLTLNNNNDLKLGPNKTDNDKLFSYGGNATKPKNNNDDDDDLFGTGNKGLNLGGFGKPNNDNLFGKKDEPSARGGGRDRTHLMDKNNDNDVFGAKKEPIQNNKASFDPDDIFGSNDKPVKKENKVDAVGGFGLGAFGGGSSNNQSTGTLGPTGIPGVRTGRGGVPGRPKQIGAQDDDLFGSSNTKNVPATNNSNAAGLGLGFGLGGGAGFGGFGGSTNNNNNDNDKFGLNLPSKAQEEDSKPRRMRMNDPKQKDDLFKNKEKNLASQAENGGGFFDEFQL